MSDSIGTVRLSPEGVVAVRAKAAGGLERDSTWLASVHEDRTPRGSSVSWWRNDDDVSDWKVIYTPPLPVGTVMRRAVLGDGNWEVAVSTDEGWVWAGREGLVDTKWGQPYDDEEGAWEVLHEPGA